MGESTEIRRGQVSLTQIKELAKELNKGDRSKKGNDGKYLVYNMKMGRGFVSIVNKGYKLKSDEVVILDERGFTKLVTYFYGHTQNRVISSYTEHNLYAEINLLASVIMKQLPTKEQLAELYKDIQTFKSFYSEVRKLPRDIVFYLRHYDLKGEEKVKVQLSLSSVLSLAAKELGLERNLVEDNDEGTNTYSFNYFNNFYIRENVEEIYNFEVKSMLKALNFDDAKYRGFYAYCKELYAADKETFYKLVEKDTYFYYYYYADFMNKLNKDRNNFKLADIKQFYSFAEGLKADKNAVRGLLNQNIF